MRTKLRSKITLLFMTFGLLLAIPAVALASDVDIAVVDVTVPTNSVTLAPGGSANITLNMSVTGNQTGTATFEVYKDWTLQSNGTFVGSNPEEFTVGPRGGGDPATTFSRSGTVSVASGAADGAYTLAAQAFDITNTNTTGAKLAAGDPSNYQVTVETPTPSDTTPPVISKVVTGTLGTNGWYRSNVSVDWTVTDDESAISSQSGCADFSLTSDQNAVTYTCEATSAGGTSSDSVTIKIDKTAPTNVAFVGGPAAGGSYDPDSVPAAPTCTANGDISGLASCNVSGYSANVGSHTLTATATDNAGNVNDALTSTYEVKGWTLNGFYHPVDMLITNTVKAGQTVPLKFEMFEQVSKDELTNTGAVKTFAQKVTCGSFTPTEDLIEEYSSGSTSLRHDGSQFIFNWQTPKSAGSCFKVTMTPNDTSSNALVANFKLK